MIIKFSNSIEKIHLESYAHYLKPRLRDWHKGLSGHVLIIGGDLGFSGAPRMAALAALRVGAGLVSVATHPLNAPLMNAVCPEIMCHGVERVEEIKNLATKATVMVLGPGLGLSEWSYPLWEYSCELSLPIVVDADGLNWLAKENKSNEKWILTPHAGEAARLLNTTAQRIQEDRLKAATVIQKKYGGVCVLKGAGTLVIASETAPAICEAGNPGMATAGMGDILSGVIGGLLAQHIPLAEAAKLGVGLHAAAGDLAAKQGERGMIATDLLPYLRQLVNIS